MNPILGDAAAANASLLSVCQHRGQKKRFLIRIKSRGVRGIDPGASQPENSLWHAHLFDQLFKALITMQRYKMRVCLTLIKSPTSFLLAFPSQCSAWSLISNRFDQVRAFTDRVLFEFGFPGGALPSRIVLWQLHPNWRQRNDQIKRKRACIF